MNEEREFRDQSISLLVYHLSLLKIPWRGPISRVLFVTANFTQSEKWGNVAIIPLGRQLPAASSGLPESRNEPGRLCSLFDLAPSGVYLAKRVTPPAGALLPHHFTLTGGAISRQQKLLAKADR